jgi:AraC-like DNA-binding protein
VARLFRDLYQAMTGGADHEILQADQALLQLLDALLQPPGHAQPRPLVPRGIATARAWIDDDPAAPLTLAALAKEAGLSRFQFLRGFARETGLTPHAYLMQRRIHRARNLIATGAGLAEAATASGFSDQSHMTRLFVRSFGMAPGSYARARA